MSEYRKQLEDWLKTLDIKAGLVIDWGGKQNPVKNRVKSWDVKDYWIWDLPEMNIEAGWGSWHGMDLNAMEAEESIADIVFCLETIEYTINPLQAFRNIKIALKPGGKAYISVPLIYPVHEEIQSDSLRLTMQGIHRLAERVGLKIKEVHHRRDKSGLLQSFYAADGMHPAKDWDHSVTGYIVELIK